MTWREAFFEQARSDNMVRRLLNRNRAADAHQLHYLQMTAEKLSKGYLSDPTSLDPPKMTHKAFVKCLRVIKGRPEIRRQLGYRKKEVFWSYIDSLLPLADQVEKLAPAIAGFTEPNPEYPWKGINANEVTVPAKFTFPQFNPKDVKLIKLLNLIDSLLSITN